MTNQKNYKEQKNTVHYFLKIEVNIELLLLWRYTYQKIGINTYGYINETNK